MELTESAVNDLNIITDWLVVDDFDLNNKITPDLLILVGHAIIPTILGAIDFANRSEIPILFSGGIGHSTELLKQAVYENSLITSHSAYSKCQSEASIFLELSSTLFDMSKNKIYLEEESTNCGLNAEFSLDLILKENLDVKNVVLVQDPIVQRRTSESFKYASQQKKIFYHYINWPVFKPKLKLVNNKAVIIGNQIPGIWDISRYISMILGEIKRLRDDLTGYGPSGAGFIGHVDIPENVDAAWQRLAGNSYLSKLIR